MATTQYSNVMHDKRVVRGSTFGSHPHAAVSRHYSTTHAVHTTTTKLDNTHAS